jgi:hypothetical protein
MPVPIARPVSLPPEEHARLESLVRAHSTPQALAFRCRRILRITAPDHPFNLHVATERSAGGVSAWPTACRMPRARVARRAFPPSERIEVLAMATKKPAPYHCPATRWSLDDLVAALPQHRLQPISRSSIWRLMEEADLKPHQ